ncbi:TraA family conjugative transfer protein [Cupriavidus sp. TMH.W2]|uniref:TraA family conjugative transfer protein n=1 Tax=Cupriavidus sp. TMH.W2 TaxID=3434465 RepID=UPI003D7710AC
MKRNKQALLTLAIVAVALAVDASAATDGTFNQIVDRLTGWMTGSLGTTFALGSLAVGLAMGVVKQSVMSVVTGVAVALSASLGPSVLQGLFTATL